MPRWFAQCGWVNPNNPEPPLVNVGCGQDQTILELAQTVRAVIGYDGKFVCDTSKPDGTPRKLLSIERISELGWSPRVSLEEGIRLAYADYLASAAASRSAT